MENLWQFFVKGGFFMIPIGLCSIIALAVILERAFSLARHRIINAPLATAILKFHHTDDPTPLEQLCARETTALCRIVKTCFMHLNWTKFENSEAMQTRARAEVSAMERNLVWLEIITGVAPLLGLLGTVSGLVVVFSSYLDQGMVSQGPMLAKGIAEALNTTVFGLVVAIPSMMAHGIFSRRVESYAVELEILSTDLLGKLYTSSDDEENFVNE
ncbi:MAG: MotA/TolQ/ExbB proton channel family protein [Methylacidiphilales bacterium]|nr:MotA/TolQ/ExbB proton channel family protein [Candidatus Methylacidiphilales bacterium]MDW8348809.1 MotA/TolQ/ExbB proton channel family protein [Verrucomicrobiae bacterium]